MATRSSRSLLLTILLATAAAAASKPCTLFDPSSVPTVVDTGPEAGVEVGVKFKSEVNGTISAIRFYKASANTGPHVARLWTISGTLLASATSSNETSFGWQQVELPAPVIINAGAVYVASYHANAGHYSFSAQYFARSGVDKPPLHAPANKDSGGNGVYAYGETSVFPGSSDNSANYWVDVVFTPKDLALVAITVKPASASILAGASSSFTATGKYSDGSTQDLAGLAVWEARDPGIATVSSFGQAMGVS